MRGRAGTQGFWAPEIIDSGGDVKKENRTAYNHRSDWWSLGATLYNFLAGTDPFSRSNMSSFGETKLKSRNDGTRHWEIKYPDQTPGGEEWTAEISECVGSLLDRNQKTRICGIAALRKLKYLRDEVNGTEGTNGTI